MSNQTTEWSAQAVREAIRSDGRTKLSLSEETGIPYPTLNRKLAAKTEFRFSELLAIAEALGVSPALFTPPAFIPEALAASA